MPVHTRRPYHRSENLVWLVASLDWVVMTQPGGGTGGAGDASAANQVTEIARLTSIVASVASVDTKLPALGQALAGASVPVILPAATITTLTPPAAITGFATSAIQATQQTKLDNLDVALSTRTKPADQQHTIVDSGVITTVSAVTAITNALPAGAALIGKVGIDQTTPGTTNAVQANAGTNLNTSALATEAGNLASIKAKTDNLDVALSTRLKPADTLTGITTVATVTTVGAVTTITNPVSVAKTDLTPSVPTVATVGVASGSAVSAQATRKGLSLRNLSTAGQRISLGFGQTAVLDSGVTLYPQDAYEMGEYDFDLGAVNAIASAASASLAIQEWLT